MLHLGSSKGRHWTEVASLAYRRHQRRLLLHLHSGEGIIRRVENNERKEEKEVTEQRKRPKTEKTR